MDCFRLLAGDISMPNPAILKVIDRCVNLMELIYATL